MKLKYLFITILAGIGFAFSALAQDSATTNSDQAAEIQALKKEIQLLEQKVNALEQKQEAQQSPTQTEDLDQKVRILQRQRELDQEAAATTAKSQPRISLGPDGFSARSADTNFAVAIHGLVQVDSRTFKNDNNIAGNDSFLLRRARPILSGTVYRDFDFRFVPEFGNGTPGANSSASTPSILDAFINYRYSPEFQIQAGKFKSPIGLEYLQGTPATSFNERSLATDLIPGRDVGFELHGDIGDGLLSYVVGIFNGVGDGQKNSSNTSFQDNREFEGRLFVQPFKATDWKALQGLGVGVAGSWGDASITNTLGLPNTTGGSQPGFATDGQQQFFAYTNGTVASHTHWRLSPQGYYYYGPFSLLGEYVISDQEVRNATHSATLENTAWEISGGWILTGENASFTGVTPKHPFDPRNGQWGALQMVARYSELSVDDAAFPFFANPAVSASEAHAWAVGLNWYLNRNIRVNASFSRTTFTGGGTPSASAPGSVTSHPEEVFFTRVQLAF